MSFFNTKLGLKVFITWFILTSSALAACNITDNTYINSNTVLIANESICVVSDSNQNGAIIINASNIELDCGGSWTLNGTSPTVHSFGIFSNSKNNVTIKNCRVTNYKWNVYLASGQDAQFINNTLFSGFNGLALNQFINANLSNNNMTNNSYNFWLSATSTTHYNHTIDTTNTVDGKPIYYNWSIQNYVVPSDAGYVACIYCKNITVNNSILRNNGQGIVLRFTNDSLIQNNIITRNYRRGILVSYSHNNRIINNTIERTDDTQSGVYVEKSDYNKFINNTIMFNPSAGFYIITSNYTLIEGNNISSNTEFGIWMRTCQNNTFRRNTIFNNTGQEGVHFDLESGPNNTFVNSVINNNRVGLTIDSQLSYGNFVKNNSFNSNVMYGILLHAGTFNNTIINNVFLGNPYGVYSSKSSNNTVENNTFKNSSQYAIYVSSSSNNNNFTNNSISFNNESVLDQSSTSSFDKNIFQVTLTSPYHGQVTTSVSGFRFNISNPILAGTSCQLFLNNVQVDFLTNVQNNVISTFSYSPSTGSHSWYVYCNDSATTNWGNSSAYFFTIQAEGFPPLPPPIRIYNISIILINPEDRTVIEQEPIDFEFEAVSDEDIILSCNLSIITKWNGSSLVEDDYCMIDRYNFVERSQCPECCVKFSKDNMRTNERVLTRFSPDLIDGDYTWEVECKNVFGTSYKSNTSRFEVIRFLESEREEEEPQDWRECEGCISETVTPGFWITVEDDRLIIPLGITTLDIRLCDFWMIALVIIAIIISLWYYKKRREEKLTKRTVWALIALWILVAIGLLAGVCYVEILISVVILLSLIVYYIYRRYTFIL